MGTIFGPMVAPSDVERAVVSTIATWLDTYLNELERLQGLALRFLPRPPDTASIDGDSIYGGVDHNSWQEDFCPAVIVVVQPAGSTELEASSGYGQTYEVEIGSVIHGDDEDNARTIAGYYATAIAALLVQQSSLGGLATRTRLTTSPHVEFLDPDRMRIAHGLCTVEVFVQPILDEKTGPLTPDPAPAPNVPSPADPGDWPTVEHVDVEVTAEPLDEEN
jgi:hypothetical protein